MFFFGGFLFFFYLLRLWLAGFGGIHPDETYYWTWSRHLSFGYFDHPPMIAWVIRAGDFIITHLIPSAARNEYPLFFAQIGLRIIPYFLVCVLLPLVIARCIEIMQKRPLGLLQMIALLSAPTFVFGPQIVTPDLPFFLGWSLCLLASLQLLESRGLDAVPGDSTPFQWKIALFAGVSLALSAYSKHTAILAAFLFIVSGSGPYNSMVAGFTAIVLTLPHFLWYRDVGISEGAGFLFQFNNAIGNSSSPLNYKKMGDLLVSQIFIWSPLTFGFALETTLVDMKLFFLPRKVRRPTGTLFLWAFVPVIFFAITALRRPAEANWPLMGVLSALVLVISKSYDRPSKLLFTALSNVLVVFFVIMALFRPIDLADTVRASLPQLARQLEKPSRTRDFTGWDRFHTLVFEATRSNDFPIQIESFQLLSELLFFDSVMPEEAMTSRLKIAPDSRRSQFNLWPEFSMDPVIRAYWLIEHSNRAVPAGCKTSQSIYRNLDDDLPFIVMKCGF